MSYAIRTAGAVDLQAMLAAACSIAGESAVQPHHPIRCHAQLRLEDDGRLACEHGSVPAGDTRTRQCIDHSVAILLIELAQAL